MDYIFATNNKSKLKEIREIFNEKNWTVRSPGDFGISFNPDETGSTFAENAVQKAQACFRLINGFEPQSQPSADILRNTTVLADDSGLCIDALDGRPGVYSARWLGESTPYTEKNERILEMLKNIPEAKRTARFVCVIAAVFPDGRVLTAEGVIEGRIAYASKGENGFGYDPVFLLPEMGRTLAEITSGEKNSISHRGQALRAMLERLDN